MHVFQAQGQGEGLPLSPPGWNADLHSGTRSGMLSFTIPVSCKFPGIHTTTGPRPHITVQKTGCVVEGVPGKGLSHGNPANHPKER